MLAFIYDLSLWLLAFIPVKDPDFGWHYRCGKDLVEFGKPCLTNTYSYFLADYQAFYSSFLSDLILYFSYHWFGFIGVALLGSLSIFILVKLLFILIKADQSIKIVLSYIFFLLSGNTLSLGLRSQIIGLLFFTACLYLISRLRVSWKTFWIKPVFLLLLLLLLWANTHASAFVGLVLVFLFVFEQISYRHYYSVLLLPLSLLATFVNPFGYKIYWEAFYHWQMPMHKLIAEWVSPVWYLKLIMILFIVVYIYALFLKRTAYKKHIFEFLLIGLTGFLAFSARRNVPLFMIAYYYGFFNLVSLPMQIIKSEFIKLFVLMLVLSSFLIGLLKLSDSIRFNQSFKVYCQEAVLALPCQALPKLQNKSANIFTAYEWGGFLIWQLPKSKVFVDGRMPAWLTADHKSPYTSYLEIIQAQPGWNKTLRKYKTDYILIVNNTFLDLLLRKEAAKYHWKLIERTTLYALYQSADN